MAQHGNSERAPRRRTHRLVGLVLLCACYSSEPDVRQPMPDPIADVEGQTLYERGIRLARTGDLLRAEQYVNAAMEKGFPRDRALPALLRICIAASRYNDALRYAEPYLREHPNRYELRTLVASIHLALGNVVQAQDHLETAIAGAPTEAPAYYLIGMLLREEHEDQVSADPYLRKYLELAPNGTHAAEVRALIGRRQPIQRLETLIDRPVDPLAPATERPPAAGVEAGAGPGPEATGDPS